MAMDIVIKSGKVINGLGDPVPFRPWESLDIGIKDGRIVKLGRIEEEGEVRTINADGLMVSPGIVDCHNHSDGYIMENPKAESTVRQGITTMAVGNCGMSAAPIYNDFHPSTSILPGKIEYTWTTMKEYLDKIRSTGLAVNMIPLVGHSNIRAAGMGYRTGKAAAEELQIMKRVLQETFDAGAWGMSIGLIYPPGSFSDKEELVELLKVVAENGGVHHAHIRGQGETLIAAVQEAIDISEAAGAPLHIHHHKGMGDANAPKVMVTLQLVEEAISRGVNVSLDMYPYQAGQGGLAMFLPPWVHDGGSPALVERLKKSDMRKRIKMEMLEPSLTPGYQSYVRDLGYPKCWDHIIICECQAPENQALAGLTIAQAKPDGQDAFNFIFDLLVAEGGDAPVVIPDIIDLDDTYLQMVHRHPAAVFGSDGYALAPYGILGQGNPHPRSYGAFPRVLGNYVRERRLFSWHEAIRKMTSQPARNLGLSDRGVIAENMRADIMIFDPERIIDQATFDNPHQYPLGINQVLVNGEVVIDEGEHTGELPGLILER